MADERDADHEARTALMALIVRVVDEYRYGLREIDVDDLSTLASCWSDVNAGATPSERALRLLGKDGE